MSVIGWSTQELLFPVDPLEPLDWPVLEPWLEPPFDPPVLVPLPEPLDPACEPPPLEQVPVANLVPHRLVAPAYDWSIGPHIAP